MSKVDVIRKHIGSDEFYDLNGTEMLSKILAAMDEYAQEQVKNLTIPRVSNSVYCDCVEKEVLMLPHSNTPYCAECGKNIKQ